MSVAIQVCLTFGRPSFRRSARAVTLVEVLVVLVVIAVLMAILFPVLGQVRLRARMAVNLSNLRQSAVAMTTYTATNKGMFIFPVDPSAYEVGQLGGGANDVRLPVPAGQEGTAPVLVSYFWVADYWPEVLEYAGVVGSGGAMSEAFGDVDLVTGKPSTRFLFSCSLLANHEYWNQTTRLSGGTQLRPPTIDSVQAPASKIMFFSFADHLRVFGQRPIEMRHSSVAPAFAMVDGSASTVRSQAVKPGISTGDGGSPQTARHSMDFGLGLHTVNGNRGADIRN